MRARLVSGCHLRSASGSFRPKVRVDLGCHGQTCLPVLFWLPTFTRYWALADKPPVAPSPPAVPCPFIKV